MGENVLDFLSLQYLSFKQKWQLQRSISTKPTERRTLSQIINTESKYKFNIGFNILKHRILLKAWVNRHEPTLMCQGIMTWDVHYIAINIGTPAFKRTLTALNLGSSIV